MVSEAVTLIEVGPRDGLQFEKPVSTEFKETVINGLVEAGLRRIQVTSFVHPKWVPQMADAEALCARLPAREDVIYSGLTLNDRGVERAHEAGLSHVDVSISTSDAHSQKNANMSIDEAMEQMTDMVDLAHHYGMRVRAGLQCVFGCAYEGAVPVDRVVRMARRVASSHIEMLSLADSTGMAQPRQVKAVVERVQDVVGDTPIALHLHDTHGLGMANLLAGLNAGIRHFDTAMAGMGGCPFIPGAAGNVATEDAAYALEQMGFSTGVDREAVSEVSLCVEDQLNKRFPGKHHRLHELQHTLT